MAQGCKAKRKTYRRGLREATTTLLPREAFALLPTADGKTRRTSLLLALCAILIVWSGAATLADRFESARRCLLRWYPGRRRPGAGRTRGSSPPCVGAGQGWSGGSAITTARTCNGWPRAAAAGAWAGGWPSASTPPRSTRR